MRYFLILTSSLTALTFFAAGILPFTISALAIIFCLACLFLIRGPQSPGLKLLPLLASVLIAFLTITAIPFPSPISSAFGSKRAQQNNLAKQAIRTSAELGISKKDETCSAFAVTRNRAGTARIILLVIAGIASAALASQMPAQWKDRYIQFLVLLGIILAAGGFISQWIIPQGKTIWWLFPVPHGRPVGCFINRNHFGGYVALMCAPAMFLLADSLEKRRPLSAFIWLAGLAVMSLAVIMSLSKGAWLAFAISMSSSFIILLYRRKFILVSSFILILLVLLISIARINPASIPSSQVKERLLSMRNLPATESASMRLSTWRDGLAIIRDYPVLGAGANAFRMVFPQYRKATTRKPFEHAENEYVQIPAEFGLPAAAVIIAMLVVIARQWQISFLIEKHILVSSCVGGMLLASAVHASTDFALRIPLYFLTVTSMLGLVISPSPPVTQSQPAHSRLNCILSTTALAIALAFTCMGGRIYTQDSSDDDDSSRDSEICRTLAWSPTSWQAWYRLGKSAVAMRADNMCRFGEKCISRAAEYDPNNYQLWQELALLRLSLQDAAGAAEAYSRIKQLRPWKKINDLEQNNPVR